MIRPHYPRSIRSRLLLATVVSVGIALILLVLAFNLLFARRLSVNATDQARARAAAALSTIDMSGGQVEVREAPDGAAADAPVWVFVDGRALEAPRTSTLNNAAARISSGNGETLDAGDYRLVAVPVVAGGRQVGSVVAAVSLAPYEEAQHTGADRIGRTVGHRADCRRIRDPVDPGDGIAAGVEHDGLGTRLERARS